VTNFGGGLNGTGVPFTFIKYKIDHNIKNKPKVRISKDAKMFDG